jgi:hypothetical protein
VPEDNDMYARGEAHKCRYRLVVPVVQPCAPAPNARL